MPVLISGLKKLEYRGYDSADIAVSGDQGILIRKQSGKVSGHVIEIPACPQYTSVVPAAVTLQLFACHVARIRGCAIDQPRNLAKSVTVE